MRRPLLAAVSALAIASLACSINFNLPDVNLPQIETGPEQTFTVLEAAPNDVDVVEVNLNMGAGSLTLVSE